MFYSIEEIKRANRQAGRYFFEPDSMRFFDSRILSGVYNGPGGCYFITSERFHGSNGVSAERAYTVRKVSEDGDVNTAGDFNKLTLYFAEKYARALAAGTMRIRCRWHKAEPSPDCYQCEVDALADKREAVTA